MGPRLLKTQKMTAHKKQTCVCELGKRHFHFLLDQPYKYKNAVVKIKDSNASAPKK